MDEMRKHRDGLGDLASEGSGTVNNEPSATQQQFADQVDVNKIVRRFMSSGQVPVLQDNPRFGDFPTIDLHEAMNIVRSTEEAFMRLPSQLRKRFGNDPGELWTWLQDPANDDEAVKLGLFTAKPEEIPKVS